eukprot:2153894-Alexandrium_andersonii.AAC.1
MEETLVDTLEKFRHAWWAEFNYWVLEKIMDDYNPDQWRDAIEWCGKERMERRLKTFYQKHKYRKGNAHTPRKS